MCDVKHSGLEQWFHANLFHYRKRWKASIRYFNSTASYLHCVQINQPSSDSHSAEILKDRNAVCDELDLDDPIEARHYYENNDVWGTPFVASAYLDACAFLEQFHNAD